jgi:hypothetical protein
VLNPVIDPVKYPNPVPEVTLLSAVVGLADVDQHNPLSVTAASPSPNF